MSTTMDVEGFIAELQRELRAKQLSLLDAEFLAAVEAGTVTREQIGAWARVFYGTTRNGRLSIGNFYANSPDDPVLRRELAENLYEEETGRISGVNRGHMDVFFEYCTRIFEALRDNYAFSDHELTWFSMHAALDADHGAEFRRHAVRAADAPDGLERLRERTLFMSAAVKHVWDGFGIWRSAATAG